jgi:hypothetical protein
VCVSLKNCFNWLRKKCLCPLEVTTCTKQRVMVHSNVLIGCERSDGAVLLMYLSAIFMLEPCLQRYYYLLWWMSTNSIRRVVYLRYTTVTEIGQQLKTWCKMCSPWYQGGRCIVESMLWYSDVLRDSREPCHNIWLCGLETGVLTLSNGSVILQ